MDEECLADGGRIAVMIPIIAVTLAATLLSSVFLFLTHRSKRNHFNNKFNLSRRVTFADVSRSDNDQDGKPESATTSIQGDPPTQNATTEGAQAETVLGAEPAATEGAHSAANLGGEPVVQVAPMSVVEEGDFLDDSGCPLAAKVLALSVGMAAETVAVAAIALLFKALPVDTSDSASPNFCPAGIVSWSACLATATCLAASVILVTVVRLIGKDMLEDT